LFLKRELLALLKNEVSPSPSPAGQLTLQL